MEENEYTCSLCERIVIETEIQYGICCECYEKLNNDSIAQELLGISLDKGKK